MPATDYIITPLDVLEALTPFCRHLPGCTLGGEWHTSPTKPGCSCGLFETLSEIATDIVELEPK